ncbi:MAG: hypothetical protein KJO07_22530, partial [Deltaproteobacteria bacterium]|nr:hypothetical protein [Deltaproteobacteria bacterium]
LAEKIGADPTRGTVIDECQDLVDGEVKAKRGMSGAAIKLGYKTVKAIKPGFVRGVIDGLLDDWLVELEPFHGGWLKAGGSFAEYVTARSDEVAEAMLSVTDRAATETKHKTAAKMYRKMRPSAKDNVIAALPKLGAIIEKHL